MLDRVIASYDEAWNASDDRVRMQLLERSLSSDVELVDPNAGRFRGREAVNERLAGFAERFPGARVRIVSGVDEHHGFARYAWAIADAGGELMMQGIDVIERAEDGRIERVVMFVGDLPTADG